MCSARLILPCSGLYWAQSWYLSDRVMGLVIAWNAIHVPLGHVGQWEPLSGSWLPNFLCVEKLCDNPGNNLHVLISQFKLLSLQSIRPFRETTHLFSLSTDGKIHLLYFDNFDNHFDYCFNDMFGRIWSSDKSNRTLWYCLGHCPLALWLKMTF